MSDVHFYKTSVKWEEGRIGLLSAPELHDIKVATPPEFPKGVSGIWSPEHLFVASVNVCFMTTFLAIAENSKLNFISFNCEATGKLEKVDNKFMISEIELIPTVEIEDENLSERLERILNKSEVHCLISNSVKTKVILKPNIVIKN
jgi:organic hydroperoxide reductase OsmC/OhrA